MDDWVKALERFRDVQIIHANQGVKMQQTEQENSPAIREQAKPVVRFVLIRKKSMRFLIEMIAGHRFLVQVPYVQVCPPLGIEALD